MQKIKLSSILVLSILLVAAGFTFAAAQDDVTLTMWSWRTEDVDEYNAILDTFEENNPGISVEFKAFKNTEYNTVLATSLEGGEGPDVMQLRAYGGLQRYTDFLMPLGDKVPALKDFPGSSLASAEGRNDGKLYGVPFANQVLGIYYNKEIFEKYDLSEPKTWDEFLSVCETLKENGVTPLANAGKAGWMLEIMFGTFGPNFYGGNSFFEAVTSGETNFEDPAFVNALEKMTELKPYMQPGFMGVDYSSQQAAFYTEQAAMFVGGSFEATFFQEQNPELDIGVFPAPPQEDDDPVYIGTWADGSFGVNKSTNHQDAALKLVKFLASPEFGQPFTNMLGQISPVPGVKPNPEKVPVLSKFTNMLSEYEPTPYIMLVGFRWEKPSGSVVLQNSLQGLMQGGMTSEEVAEKVQNQIATWYDPFQ